MKAKDILNRNNLFDLIRHSKSDFFLIFNSRDQHDMENHLFKLCELMKTEPQYGIVKKGNIIFWLYDAMGIDAPHNAQENKWIFVLIDYIAKRVHVKKYVNENLENIIFAINEGWKNYWHMIKENMDLRKSLEKSKTRHPYIVELESMPLSIEMETAFSIGEVTLKSENNNYAWYGYTEFFSNCIYSISFIIEADIDECSVLLVDTKNSNKILLDKTVGNKEKAFCNFVITEVVYGLCFRVYAGIWGKTKNQSINLYYSCPQTLRPLIQHKS